MCKKAMRLSHSVWDVSDEALKTYSENGIHTIELSLGSMSAFPYAGFENLKARAEQYGVETYSFHLPFCPFNEISIATRNPDLRQFSVGYLSELIKRVASEGFSVAVIHPSHEPIPDETRAENIKCAKDSLSKLADVCEQNGMVLAVEDLPRTCLGNTISEMKELIADDDRLRVCFDTNHLLTEYATDFIYALRDKIVTLHVSDYDFRNERHWMPYEGKLDWVKLVTALEEIGYSGPFTYEVGLYPEATINRRVMTYADMKANYQALMEKRPAEILGTPNVKVCEERDYYKEPKI